MRLPRLGVRARLLVATVGAVALALVVAVSAFSFFLGQRLSASATSLAKARAEAEASALTIRDGALVAPKGPVEGRLGSQVWIFAGARTLEAPRTSREIDRAARSLAFGPARVLNVGEHTRLYGLPVVQNGVRYGTVVSAVSLDPYEETGRTALIGSLALAFLVLGAITVLSRWMLGRAFLPVSRMTEDAASWSDHDLDRRFELGEPYDELTRLAATLDSLLERIAASMRHEQRFSAELSHELRTPLTRISGEAELMLRQERTADEYQAALEAIHRSAGQMTRTVETLVAAARRETDLRSRRVTLESVSSPRCRTSARPAHRSRSGSPFPPSRSPSLPMRSSSNGWCSPCSTTRSRYGRSVVDVALVRNGASALVCVGDDGPGVADDERERIFEPGVRGAVAKGRAQGAGLGLSLAQRLARSAGGEITVTPGSTGGRFTLRLPLAR